MTGIREAGHTEIQPLLCCVAEAVSVLTGLAMQVVSCYGHDTTGEALQLQISHICFTHTVFTIRFLSENSGGNFAPAELITMLV